MEREGRLVLCRKLAHLLHRRRDPARPATRVVDRPRRLRLLGRSPFRRRARGGRRALRAGSGGRGSTRVLQSVAGGGWRLRSEPIQPAGRSLGPSRRRGDRGQSDRSRRRASNRPDRRQCKRSVRFRRWRLGVGRRNLDGSAGRCVLVVRVVDVHCQRCVGTRGNADERQPVLRLWRFQHSLRLLAPGVLPAGVKKVLPAHELSSAR